MKTILKKLMIFLYRIMARILPLRETAVFMSNMGKNCSGNPRAIYEEIKKQRGFADWKKVWVFTRLRLSEGGDELPGGAEIVTYGSFRYYRVMATAKLWVFDTRQEPYLVKRRGCFYLQTWHGTPLKKLGLDITELAMTGEKDAELYREHIITESRKWSLLLSPNPFSTKAFRSAFGYGGEVLECGYPRNDILFNAPALGGDSRRTILYAPTWRDDEYVSGGWYRYSAKLDFARLEELIGDSCRVILKLHYLVRLQPGDIPESVIESGFLTVCGNDTDIAELYPRADILVTDYSSVMFDYAVLRRPMFFFVYDYERYRDNTRGFYFDPAEVLPGPMSRTTEELARDIREYDRNGLNEEYAAKLNSFVIKFCPWEDGRASKRVAERIAKSVLDKKDVP